MRSKLQVLGSTYKNVDRVILQVIKNNLGRELLVFPTTLSMFAVVVVNWHHVFWTGLMWDDFLKTSINLGFKNPWRKKRLEAKKNQSLVLSVFGSLNHGGSVSCRWIWTNTKYCPKVGKVMTCKLVNHFNAFYAWEIVEGSHEVHYLVMATLGCFKPWKAFGDV